MPSRSHPARPILKRPVAASVLAAAAAAALAPVRPAAAQLQPLPAPLRQLADVPDDANKGKESNEPVYVRDSAVAQEKMTLAGRMERLKEWNKSADVYQEVLEKYRDRVVPDGTDAKGVINRYTSVRQRVLAQLSKWPAEGLDVYRGRYEPKAAELVQNAKADDLFSLHKAYDLYFVTESGKVAGLRLVDAHLEKGEYTAAAQIGDQLLDTHPGLITEKPAVLFRTALAYHLAGNTAAARRRADQLGGMFPKEMGVVKGKDILLTDALTAEMARDATAAAAVGGADSWPTFGGSPSRGVVSSANASPGTRLVSIPLAKPQYPNMSAGQKAALQQQAQAAAETGATLGIMPAADRGELFFQDGQRVYAVSLDSGLPLPGWAATYPDRQGQGAGQYVLPNSAGPARGMQQTLTLTDRHVLAVMGQPDRQGMPAGMNPQGMTRLVCLDRATGKEVWTTTPAKAADVPKNEDEKAVRGLQLSGSPLVVGDNVLAIGRSNKPTQGEDCYVLAFDLSNGKFRWGCYVASSGAMGVQLAADTTSHLAYADGRVYVLTNLGAVAALDAYSGTIAWLDIYPLDRPEIPVNAGFGGRGGFNAVWNQGMVGGAARFKPWMFNPVVAQDGKLFMLPTEGKNLIVYDAATGREVKRINLDQVARWHSQNGKTDRPTTLVGVNAEKLVLAGESRVICIDWKAYDEESFPGRDDAMIVWPSVVSGSIRGRCFMTDKSVYVPADDRLRRLELDQGSAVEDYPRYPRSWEDGEGPGNILVTGDRVVVAGSNSVDVYTDLNAARRKLDRDLALAPNDPDARLRYAEVMFVAGQTDVAVKRLDEAMDLLGGADKMKPGPARDRAFAAALLFAQKSAAPVEGAAPTASAAARAAGLFDRAGAAAATPQQRVQYRLARAAFAQGQKQPAAAVGLYQEILTDPAARAVALTDEQTGSPAQAEAVAEKAIFALIRSAGAEVYAPYQEQAAKAVADAGTETDPRAQAAKLLAAAQVYPNATVAADATLAAADAYESAGDPPAAIRVLRQMWFKSPKGPNRAGVLEGLARNYLAQPAGSRPEMVAAAAARLAQGESLPGEPKLAKALKLPDGTTVAEAGTGFHDALAAVRKVDVKEAAAPLPDFHLQIPPTLEERAAGKKTPKLQIPGTVVPGATSLVLPARDFARPDRVVTWSAGTGEVSVFAAGELKPLATVKAFATGPDAPAPRGVAWAGESAFVWGGTKLVAVGAAGGAAWEIDFAKLPALDVVRPPEVAPPLAQADANIGLNGANINGGLVINGQVRARVIRNGIGMPVPPARAGAPAGPPPGDPPPPPPTGGEQVVEVRPVGDRVLATTTAGRVLAVDVASGQVAWQTRLSDNAPDRLVTTADFAVVKASDDLFARLFALDTYSGRLIGIKSYALSGPAAPVNLALSASGILVYTLPDQLCLKDLYKEWDADEKVVPSAQGLAAYAGATQPGQLVVAGGRILAVADSSGSPFLGMLPGEKYVRVHSLETGQPVSLRYEAAGDGGKRQVDLVLQSGTKEWNVLVRVVGSHLYVAGPQSLYGYNLDSPAENWKGATNSVADRPQGDVNFRDAFVGRDYLVIADQPPPAAPGGRAGYRLNAYARYHQSGADGAGESGKLDYSVAVTDPAGVLPQWQAADGGFYYATGDGKVRLLRGTREP